VESTKNPKYSARRKNEDLGQKILYIVGRHKRSKDQEKYDTGPRRGQKSHKEENQNEESIPTWFYIGIIANIVDNKRNNRTSAPSGKVDGDTRSLNGIRRRAGYRQGYTHGRRI
jgi:hypothetical protein